MENQLKKIENLILKINENKQIINSKLVSDGSNALLEARSAAHEPASATFDLENKLQFNKLLVNCIKLKIQNLLEMMQSFKSNDSDYSTLVDQLLIANNYLDTKIIKLQKALEPISSSLMGGELRELLEEYSNSLDLVDKLEKDLKRLGWDGIY